MKPRFFALSLSLALACGGSQTPSVSGPQPISDQPQPEAPDEQSRELTPLVAADDACGTVTPNLYIRDFRGREFVDQRTSPTALTRDGTSASDSLSHNGVEASYSASCAVRSESEGALLFDVSLSGRARRVCGVGPNGSNGRVYTVWTGRVELPTGSDYVIAARYDASRSASDSRDMRPPSACRIEVGAETLPITAPSDSRDFSVSAGTVLIRIDCSSDSNDGLAATGCYGAGNAPVSPEAITGNLHAVFAIRRAP